MYDSLYKIVIMGGWASGKSCLAQRLVDNTYSDSYLSTVNRNLMTKDISLNNHNHRISIYDDFNPGPFGQIQCNYNTVKTNAFLLCIDLNDVNSINDAEKIFSSMKSKLSDREVILIGTKCDLNKVLSDSDIEGFRNKNNIRYYYETSAKNGSGCDKILENITSLLNSKKKPVSPQTINYDQEYHPEKTKCPTCVIL